jgi:hypothetical protein
MALYQNRTNRTAQGTIALCSLGLNRMPTRKASYTRLGALEIQMNVRNQGTKFKKCAANLAGYLKPARNLAGPARCSHVRNIIAFPPPSHLDICLTRAAVQKLRTGLESHSNLNKMALLDSPYRIRWREFGAWSPTPVSHSGVPPPCFLSRLIALIKRAGVPVEFQAVAWR